MKKLYYTHNQFSIDIHELAAKIKQSKIHFNSIYAVPRGGAPLASALSVLLTLPIISKDKITSNTLIVDDLVDSGQTRSQFLTNYFACLHLKSHAKYFPDFVLYKGIDAWIVYWWEENEIDSASDIVLRQLQYIGEDPNREGLIETPKRVLKAWDHIFSGYKQNEDALIKVFDSDGYDQIVLLKNIEMFSTCEHHLMSFFGKAHVAYIPNKKVLGISKLARIVDMYSKRLQIQERIGEQVTDFLEKKLNPKGVACIIEAQHLCMQMRGVEKQNSVMVTSSLKGVFKKDQKAREELMRLIK